MIPCCMSLFYSYHANCIIGISHTEIPLYSLCKERWREGGRREREKEIGKGRERERERERWVGNGEVHTTDCSRGLILLVKNIFTSRRESISGIVLT